MDFENGMDVGQGSSVAKEKDSKTSASRTRFGPGCRELWRRRSVYPKLIRAQKYQDKARGDGLPTLQTSTQGRRQQIQL